jgi:hypothetical protein
MRGGYARISRRFKVRNNLPTIPVAAIETRKVNPWQVGTCLRASLPSSRPARISPHPFLYFSPLARKSLGHYRTSQDALPPAFMENQLLAPPPSRYTDSTSAPEKDHAGLRLRLRPI